MNVAEIVTKQILEKMEQGTIPWHRPWSVQGGPRNLVSGKSYQGVNTLMLATAGYESPYWLTFKQALNKGGNVRKGEHGSIVVYCAPGFRKDADGENEEHAYLILKYYRVFNLSQCEGIVAPADQDARVIEPIEAGEKIIAGYCQTSKGPKLEFGTDKAFYRPSTDSIHLPTRDSFDNAEYFYSTAFHEMGHSTGHASRLARDGMGEHRFGSPNYSKEELIAELTAAFLCGETGIANAATLNQSTAYLQSWIKVLQNDSRFIITASSQAQKATNLILGRNAKTSESDSETQALAA
jgi:antirestriction protein ArdC